MNAAHKQPTPPLGGTPGYGAPHNPFATEFTQPGSLPWLDDGGADLATLSAKLETGRRWQIRGAQGTGKTTLLIHLARLAARTARPVALLRKPWTGLSTLMRPDLPPGTLLAIDSFDRAPITLRWRTALLCRRLPATVLVTTHRPLVGFTTLHRRRASPDLAMRLTRSLLPTSAAVPDENELARWLRRPEAVRTVFREMYDRWERAHTGREGRIDQDS